MASSTDAARLKRFVRTLPQTDRYILMMSYADGLTAAEVALVLEISEPSVTRRLETLRREAEIAMASNPALEAAIAPVGATPPATLSA